LIGTEGVVMTTGESSKGLDSRGLRPLLKRSLGALRKEPLLGDTKCGCKFGAQFRAGLAPLVNHLREHGWINATPQRQINLPLTGHAKNYLEIDKHCRILTLLEIKKAAE
jgi:hypothetical protein